MKQLTLGSLFSGSGGFELAGVLHNIRPVWASEIEPFPIRVTTLRFPEMKHLGDVTKIDGSAIEPVDIVTFGSPCQNLSIAGNREGIHRGEQSSLFFEAIRIIKEIRYATNNQFPRFAVWENVKGAFSSNKGADFRSVLQSFCDLVGDGYSVPMPEKGKWAHAGCVVGDGFSIAWRLYNAEHWGVPQRRERVFLIADFGTERAGEILFEPESGQWDPDQIGTPWSSVTHDHARGTGRGADNGIDVKLCVGATNAHAAITDGKHSPTLIARAGQGGGNVPMVFTVYDARGNGTGSITPTLTGDHNNRVTDYTAICIGNGQLHQKQGDIVGAFNCMHDQQAVITPGKPPRKYTVRRLTPVECARLQGFPDWWCEGANGSDTAQYQLWGNGVALPCVADVLGRCAKALRRDDEWKPDHGLQVPHGL